MNIISWLKSAASDRAANPYDNSDTEHDFWCLLAVWAEFSWKWKNIPWPSKVSSFLLAPSSKKAMGSPIPRGLSTSNSSGVTGSSSPLGDIPLVAIWVTMSDGMNGDMPNLDIIWKLDILRLPFEGISHFQTHLCWSNHAARLSDGIPSDGNHLKSSIENLYIPTHILYIYYTYIYYTYIYIYIIHIYIYIIHIYIYYTYIYIYLYLYNTYIYICNYYIYIQIWNGIYWWFSTY